MRLRLAHLTERVHHYSYNVRVRFLVDSLQKFVRHERPEFLHCLGALGRGGGGGGEGRGGGGRGGGEGESGEGEMGRETLPSHLMTVCIVLANNMKTSE